MYKSSQSEQTFQLGTRLLTTGTVYVLLLYKKVYGLYVQLELKGEAFEILIDTLDFRRRVFFRTFQAFLSKADHETKPAVVPVFLQFNLKIEVHGDLPRNW